MTNLTASYYYKEDNTTTSDVNLNDDGVKKRMGGIAKSRQLYFSIFPYIDILSSNNFLPPHCQLDLVNNF